MKQIQKTLKKGVHILGLPINEATSLNDLFPKELAGSSIEKLNEYGVWTYKETILFQNNTFEVSENYEILQAFETIRLTLKRDVTIDWSVKFHSFSGLDEQKIDFKDGFDVAEALYFMQLSKLVYCDKEEIEEKLQKHYHFDSFQFFSKRSHKRFSLRLWNRLMVLWRGRKSMVDLQFVYLTHWDESIQKTIITIVFRGSKEKEDWLTNFSLRDRPMLGKGMVHQGFNEAYRHFLQMTKRGRQDLRKKLSISSIDEIETFNKKHNIVITGHSMGGAVATLVGCLLLDLGIKKENLKIYNFGTPPIGNKKFVDYYKDKINLYRVVNEQDLIPKLNRISRFYHLGEEILLASNDGEGHSCDGYIDNLIDLV